MAAVRSSKEEYTYVVVQTGPAARELARSTRVFLPDRVPTIRWKGNRGRGSSEQRRRKETKKKKKKKRKKEKGKTAGRKAQRK